MTAQQVFHTILDIDIDEANVCVCLGSFAGENDMPMLATLNITQDLMDQFKGIVSRLLERLRNDDENNDLTLRQYDAGYKPDGHEIEWVRSADMQEIVDSLDCIPDPVVNAPMFDAQEDFIAGLHFYVIVVEVPDESRILFFRKYDPKKELSRSKWFAALLSDGQYDRVSRTTFLFDDEIDCFSRDDYMFSRRKHDFQQIFRFFEKLREKAGECLKVIENRVPIAGFDEFAASCESHLSKLSKLNNIAAKPYLQTVTMKDLKKTIKMFNLGVTTIKENGVEKLRFDPKDRWVILKLLDDDYLGSVMTKLQYEVNSKRQVSANA